MSLLFCHFAQIACTSVPAYRPTGVNEPPLKIAPFTPSSLHFSSTSNSHFYPVFPYCTWHGKYLRFVLSINSHVKFCILCLNYSKYSKCGFVQLFHTLQSNRERLAHYFVNWKIRNWCQISGPWHHTLISQSIASRKPWKGLLHRQVMRHVWWYDVEP